MPSSHAESHPASTPAGGSQPYNEGPVCLDCLGRTVNYAVIADEHGHDVAVDEISLPYGCWGADAVITQFPIVPCVGVDLTFERSAFHTALVEVARHGQPGFWAHAEPLDRAQILCAIDPGDRPTAPGALAWQARMFLTPWVEHDHAAYEFIANKRAAAWSSSEVNMLALSALGYLGGDRDLVEVHTHEQMEDAIRFVHLIGLALDATWCRHGAPRPDVTPGPARSNQIRRGVVAGLGGVPAAITTACAEVLHQMLPGLARVDGGAFLFWLAHITLWAGLNGGADAYIDTAMAYKSD